MRKITVYMAVSADELELPIALFDDISGLSRWAEISKNYLKFLIKNKSIDGQNHCKYLRISWQKNPKNTTGAKNVCYNKRDYKKGDKLYDKNNKKENRPNKKTRC